MLVTRCELRNFASYERLEFAFTGVGLALIHGATGSGKSTLADAIPWVLFGKTAKGGAVSEVLTWPGDKVTSGTIELDNIVVTRSRGPNAKDNDLTFATPYGGSIRGKDLQDTQRMINQIIGIDADLYLSGAYYHEFSQTAQFFTTTAKNRRTICEQLVDLSMPKKLQEKIKETHKILTQEQNDVKLEINAVDNSIQTLVRLEKQENNRANEWHKTQEYKLSSLRKDALSFEASRERKINQLIKEAEARAKSSTCAECGAVKTAEVHRRHDNNSEVKRIEAEENIYLSLITSAEKELNPHVGSLVDFSKDIESKTELLESCKLKLKTYNVELTDLDILHTATQDFRSLLIKNTILDLESKTNVHLSNHFDAEISIELSIETDKLEVNILKDGNIAAFTQLSKGQRQMLKLCFGAAVMECIENHHGVKFEQLFFDEALDGLDDNFKAKAFKLFNTLSLKHDSVFVVEHSSDFKTMFDRQFKVELINGKSEIEEA